MMCHKHTVRGRLKIRLRLRLGRGLWIGLVLVRGKGLWAEGRARSGRMFLEISDKKFRLSGSHLSISALGE